MGSLPTPSPIPVIDLSAYLSSGSSPAQRQAAARELAAACHTQGCVGISGHGYPAAALADLFATSARLFALPHEDKIKAPHPKDSYSPHRGYSSPGSEKAYSTDELKAAGQEETRAKGRRIVDFKEHYEVGDEANTYDHNIWLPEEVLPGFKATTLKAFWDLHAVSMRILDALLDGLDLSDADREYVRKLHSGLNDQLRLLHYPPIPTDRVDDELLGRMPAHHDFSTFTLLFQDECGGLQFQDRSQKEQTFVDATPKEGVVYLNVGEMMQRLTNDYLPAAVHRVTIPNKRVTASDGATTTPPRYSFPFFFMPDPLEPIFPLGSAVKGGEKAYDTINIREYGEWKSRWTYKKE